jgi:catalase (peroxidase I)
MLDFAVSIKSMLAAMFLRLSFHDAGTFDQTVSEGGANGCLMTDATMLMQEENNGLDIAIETLKVIKLGWEAHPMTCVETSNADFIQFAGLFAAVRQLDIPGMTSTKITQLLEFQWGRKDEPNCDIDWTLNLPHFNVNDNENETIPARCLMAGGEIKIKMMDKNGFTSEEATALIGAHTIGLTRTIFGDDHAAPWVANGADDATVDGPVFDNKFFDFLENTIVEDTADAFAANIAPFTLQLFNWFQTESTPSSPKLNHLDTDIVLAFPTQDASVHPNFHDHTTVFANNNNYFLDTFFKALDKMSKLGVINVLSNPTPLCAKGCVIFGLDFSQEILESDLRFAISTAEKQLELKQESRNQEELKKLTTPVQQFILSEDNKVAVPVDDALFKV